MKKATSIAKGGVSAYENKKKKTCFHTVVERLGLSVETWPPY
jgi:hypothetical protein